MQQEFMRLLQRAAGHFQRGDFATALRDSEEALRLLPGHPEGLHMKALALGRLGRVDEALPIFDAAAATHPQKHAILANKGNALRAAGRSKEAVPAYKEAINAYQRFLPAWMGLGQAYRQEADIENAETAFRQAISLSPQNPEALNNLGLLYSDASRYEEAVKAFSEALKINSSMVSALVNRGSALRQLGRHEEALSDHRKSVALEATNAEAQYQLGACYRHMGMLGLAESALLAALQEAPERVDIQRDLARMLWEMGESGRFLAPLNRAIEASSSAELRSLKSELAYRAGQIGEAESAAQDAIELNPRLSDPWRMIGCVRQHQGRTDDALQAFEQALEVDPGDFQALHEMVLALLAVGDCQRARGLLERDAPEKYLQTHIALRATTLRLLSDPLYKEYYDYERFARKIIINTPDGYADLKAFNNALVEAIKPLHATKAQPLDQTLYGGTQSVGRLWDNPAPPIRALRDALLKAAADYVGSLPDDPSHPFLAQKSYNLECAGAWSVMLSSGGGHVDHIHPEGWISASYYACVPEEVLAGDEKAGHLRLGATGVQGVELEAERWIRPEEGAVVFFPSYMWHGVEKFEAKSPRVTAPFDLRPAR